MRKATEEEWTKAKTELDDLGYSGRPLDTDAEVFEVLDSMADGDDVIDNLEEHRMWRTPMGRRQEAYDAWDSGRF